MKSLRFRYGVLAFAVVMPLGAVLGCSGEPEAPSATPADVSSKPAPVEPLTAPMRATAPRWASSNVPRSVPEPTDDLPDLFDDLPKRALVASYVPRTANGFDGEAVEFYGSDGHWRRLDLGDLDLPDDGWNGGDTYGAGSLSPDGRWWAAPMYGGLFLVDLRDGTTTVHPSLGRNGMTSFRWSPDSDEMVVTLIDRNYRFTTPGLRVRPFPKRAVYPVLRADGSWIDCGAPWPRPIHRCVTYASDGTVVEDRAIPKELATSSGWVNDETPEARFVSLAESIYGNHDKDRTMVRTNPDFEVNATLVMPKGSEINNIGPAFSSEVYGLQSLTKRSILAWLVDQREIVRVLRPGVGNDSGLSQDFWDVSFAKDLVQIR